MEISNLKCWLFSQKDQCIWMKRMIKICLTKWNIILGIFQNNKMSQNNYNLRLNIFINIMFLININSNHFIYFHSHPVAMLLPTESESWGTIMVSQAEIMYPSWKL